MKVWSIPLRTRFRGIDTEVARHGCALVLSPSRADRDLLPAEQHRAVVEPGAGGRERVPDVGRRQRAGVHEGP